MLVQYYHKLQKQPPEVLCKKGVLRSFATFTGKHLCQGLFFNKVEKPFQNTSGRLLPKFVLNLKVNTKKVSIKKLVLSKVSIIYKS